MNQRKKVLLFAIGGLISLCLILSGSYAYWQITKTQTDTNKIATGCFDISISENTSGINISSAYPVTDEDGMNNAPYSFTINNKCGDFAVYQVNLEVLNATTLLEKNVKAVLNSNKAQTLNKYKQVDTTLNNTKNSFELITGGLNKGESVTYELRIWMDENTTLEEGQNKIFESKIVIISSPMNRQKYCAIFNDPICGSKIMIATDSGGKPEYEYLNGSIKKSEIESITILTNKKISNAAIAYWDVSEAQDGSVMAWYEDNDSNELFELYIGSDGGVIANEDSSYLFCDLTNLKKISLSDFSTINATSMNGMFKDSGTLTTELKLDLSNFLTDKLSSADEMFLHTGSNSQNLEINLKNANFNKIENSVSMFEGIPATTKIYTKNITSLNFIKNTSMFNNAITLSDCSQNICP